MAEVGLDSDGLREAAERIRWFHRIELGQGVVTKGEYDPRPYLEKLRLPASLAGRSVLDVGAWDGFYSFAMERRGAARVLATDWFSWVGDGWGSKEGFELARNALDSKVEDLDIDVLDLSAARVGRFDVVLFLGVLYHLRNPMLALERVYDVTGDLLVLETEVDMLFSRRPAAAFYPGSELGRDATNWWGPNPKAVLGMLKAAGFRRAVVAHRHRLPHVVARAAHRALRRGDDFSSALRRDRVVFHAWR